MDIYENIIIGNFLFGLGLKMGLSDQNAHFKPASIELIQQTPLDKLLGDVRVRSAKLVLLLEFKRVANKSPKEGTKRDTLYNALQRDANFARLEKLSRRVHWYVRSDFKQKQTIDVVPYLDLTKPPGDVESFTLEEFIDFTAQAVNSDFPFLQPTELEYCDLYMQKLARCNKDDTTSSGCLIVTINEHGEITFVPVADMRRDFNLTIADIGARQRGFNDRGLNDRGLGDRTQSRGR